MKKAAITLILAVVFGTADAQMLVDKIVAVVDEEIILKSEVDFLTESAAMELKIDPRTDPQKYEKLWKENLQNKINEKIILVKAREDSVEVSDEQVEMALNQRIDQLISSVGSQSELEERIGYDIAQIKRMSRKIIQDQLMIQAFQQMFFQGLNMTREEVNEFYEAKKDSLGKVPESFNLSHILLEIKPRGNSVNRARAKIDSIKVLLDNGADFAELAKNNSEDPGSKDNGGELGFFSRGELVPEFEEAAYALRPGAISDVVRTQFGYHIIQLIEKRDSRINCRHILIQTLPDESDEAETIKELSGIRQRILDGEDLSELALEYSDDPQVATNRGLLGWTTVENLNINEFKSVIRELKEGEISQPFKTIFGYHILKLNEHLLEHDIDIETDWALVKDVALRYKQDKEYIKLIEEAKKKFFIEIKIED
ncbi:peptidylprolyl isomerase [candidate division KSB1 bacterium]